MKVGLIGDGPAGEAIRAQVVETDIGVSATDPDAPPEDGWIIVLSGVDEEQRTAINEHACETGAQLILLETGGFGATAIDGVQISASILSGSGPCYHCLTQRLAAGDASASSESATEPSPSVQRLMGAIVGNTLATELVNGTTAPVGRLYTWPYAERDVFPVPGCPRCDAELGPAERWVAPEDPGQPDSRSLEDALARAERSIDDRVGIVSEVGEVASYPAPYYLARLAGTTGFSDVQAPAQAAGVALVWNAAFMKALGEALERYSAGVYRSDWFVRGRESDRSDVVPIDRFVRPDDWTTDPDDELPWVPAIELSTNTERLLPAETCVFPPPTRQVRPAITTGLGLGSSGMDAIRAGLLEVIERDAMMLAWYSTYEPLGVRIDDTDYADLELRARGHGLDVTPLLLTQDVDVPVVAVAVHRPDEWPRFAMGSGADLDPAAAARSALCEALQNWVELRDLGRDGATQAGGWIGEYASFPPVVESFLDVSGKVDGDDLSAATPQSSADDVDQLVAAVSAAGMTPYAAWLTPEDVRQIGFEAVRVVIPSAQPLFTDTPFFGERLDSVPGSLGFAAQPDREPHPFP